MRKAYAISVILLVLVAVLWASGPALTIIPSLVPTANKRGNSNIFQLNSAGAVSGDCAVFDANLNVTGAGTGGGCGVGGGSVSSVDGTAQNGVETVQGGSVAAITTAGTVQGSMPVRAVAGTTDTILTTDRGKTVVYSNAGTKAITLPQAGASFPSGFYFCTSNIGAGTATMTPTTSTIDGAASLAYATNNGFCVYSNGTNYFTVRGIGGGATGPAGGALTGTYPNPTILNFANANCLAFSASAGILTQGAGGSGQPCNFFVDDSNPGSMTLRGSLRLRAAASSGGISFGLTSSNGLFWNGSTTVSIQAGTVNSTSLQCSDINIATSANQGICAIGAAPSSTALLNLLSINSPVFGSGADGLAALVAQSGNGSAVTGAGRNGGQIFLGAGGGGNGTTTNGNGGSITLETRAAGAGAGSAGLNGSILFRIAQVTRLTLDGIGHLISAQTTPPAASSCGGSPTVTGATDTRGAITVGSAATGCTLTFNAAYTAAPACVVTSRGGLNFTYTTSTTALTLTNGSGDLSSTVVDYVCMQ